MTSAGLISGTPTRTGNYTVTVKLATPSANVTRTLTVGVTALLKVSSTAVADGFVGTAYSASLAASGGLTPYTWFLDSGTLPPGLSLTAGKVTGTPTERGSWSLGFRVVDAAGRVATKTLTINVYKLEITSPTVPNATKGVAYTFQFTAVGGKGTLVWARSSGTLPSGLSLTTAGKLSGTPSATGTFTFTIKCTDAAKKVVYQTYTVATSL
jgi:hypothetical protein